MPSEDLTLLIRFCQSIIECTTGNCKRLNEF